MKLKDLIIKIEQKLFFSNQVKPKLTDNMSWNLPWQNFAYDVESYLNKFFLLKNEGLFWIKSINCEFEEIKKRIKFLEEIMADKCFQGSKHHTELEKLHIYGELERLKRKYEEQKRKVSNLEEELDLVNYNR